jgi:hypothetical protein
LLRKFLAHIRGRWLDCTWIDGTDGTKKCFFFKIRAECLFMFKLY